MIDPEKVYAYFERYHGPVNESTHGWYSCTCPICGHSKFAFNPKYKLGKCWRGCFNGFVVDVIMRFHHLSYFNSRELLDNMEVGLMGIPVKAAGRTFKMDMSLPQGFTPILTGEGILGDRARNYLIGRGFDLNYLDRIGVGYCNEQGSTRELDFLGYIIIPFKRDGVLRYYIGRDFIGNKQRYKNPPADVFDVGKSELLFNEEALYLNKKVYFTEGWACASTIGSAGLSYQGSIMSDTQVSLIIKSSVSEVVIIPDAGYYNTGLKTAGILINHKKVKVIDLMPLYEKYNLKDVNELGKSVVMDLIENTDFFDRRRLAIELSKNRERSSHSY